jgi:hypothetical protein
MEAPITGAIVDFLRSLSAVVHRVSNTLSPAEAGGRLIDEAQVGDARTHSLCEPCTYRPA